MAQAQLARSIVHAADYAPTYSGNFIASLKVAAEEGRARGYRVVWVFPDVVKDYEWFRELSEERDSSSYTLSRSAGCMSHAKALARIAAKENVAILHTHFSRFDIAGWIAQAMCAAKLQRVRLVWHAHSAFTGTSASRRVKDFVKLGLMGRTSQVVPVSAALGDSVAERGCPPKRIHVIDNGVDIRHATARVKTREEVRRDWGVSPETFVMLGFGWTPIRKGVDTMLEAMAMLRQEGMDLALILAGTEELREFIRNWPDRECVSKVQVIPPAERVGELFTASDVFLSPSRAEGWPYSVAEAMLNETPVAAAKIRPLTWALEAPGIHFCETGDARSLAAAIRGIAALSQEERRAAGDQAKNFVNDRHSVREWGRQIWNLYEQILDERPALPPSAPAFVKRNPDA